jgi:cytochrome c551/c552
MAMRILIAIAVLFVIAQFVPKTVYPLTNPPVDETRTLAARARTLTPEVHAILVRACQDCHSNKTVWPWYSKVAPVSWLLSHDVSEARRHMNMSNWARYNPMAAANKLEHICEEVDQGDMPLWYYRPMHPQATLSDSDKKAICAWTRAEQAAMQSSSPSAAR